MSEPAFRVDGRVVERGAFYAAACDPARSVVVEACAGSGKTWMLVARMLRALLDGAEPHELLAITFTRAAAGEMRERLGQWIAQWAAPRSSHAERVAALRERGLDADAAERLAPRLGDLQARLLEQGRPVEIRTFHAWFSQLLRSAPLDLLDGLGLQPDMTLVEDREEHRAPVFRAFHAAVLRDADLSEDFRVLTAERGRHMVGQWLQAAWNRRIEIELADAAGVLDGSVAPAAALWPELEGVGEPAVAMRSDTWRHRLGALSARLARGKAASQAAAEGLRRAIETDGSREAFDVAWLALHTQKDERRKHLEASPLLDETCEALGLLAAQVRQHDAHLEHRRMARLSRVLLAEYAAYKRSRGLADMDDLERCALALLRDGELSGWVQERLDMQVRHLFVDEFQDTSPLQWHALHAWLSAYAGAGGGASGQRPPSVFFVGDPKQSLYRFRGAEPRVFEAAADFVVDGLAGRRLACDHTRRNAPAVVAALNAVFTAAEREGAFDGFRAHTTEVAAASGDAVQSLVRVERPARAARDAAAEPVWRDSLLEPREAAEELLREQEAEQVAAAVVGESVAGADGGKAATFVLARKRQSLRFAAAALERAHVAHGPVEDGVLMESTEALDLVAVLDALVSPQHALSLARALKSPLFGASDDDLMAIADAAGATAGWSRALQRLEAPSPALARARTLLAAWSQAATRLPPHDLLDRIVHEGDLRARTLAAVPAEQRPLALDALDAVLAQALMLDGARYATPYGFIRSLKRRIVKAPAAQRSDAVRLMTIHGAKGLEADTVLVMDADPEAQRPALTTLLIDWPVESERPARCAFVYNESRCPPSLADLLAREVQARERETMNALYVAMTRARRRLFVSATAPLAPGAGPSWWERLAPVAAPRSPNPLPRGDDGARVAAAPATLKLAPPWHRPAGAVPRPAYERASATARLGRAVHRVLEWAAGAADDVDLPALAAAASREFDADATAVARSVEAVLGSADCRPFFDPRLALWSGNEVPIADGGEVLRIDRLVLLAGPSPTWWVLDYKLHHAPDSLAEYREQLLRYAAAVARAEAGRPVRSAFITGRGELVEVTRLPQYRTNGSLFDA